MKCPACGKEIYGAICLNCGYMGMDSTAGLTEAKGTGFGGDEDYSALFSPPSERMDTPDSASLFSSDWPAEALSPGETAGDFWGDSDLSALNPQRNPFSGEGAQTPSPEKEPFSQGPGAAPKSGEAPSREGKAPPKPPRQPFSAGGTPPSAADGSKGAGAFQTFTSSQGSSSAPKSGEAPSWEGKAPSKPPRQPSPAGGNPSSTADGSKGAGAFQTFTSSQGSSSAPRPGEKDALCPRCGQKMRDGCCPVCSYDPAFNGPARRQKDVCPICGYPTGGKDYCPRCGQRLAAAPQSPRKTPFKKWIAFVLCLFFGLFGVHRFYVGKAASGVLCLLTCGLCGVWPLVDLLLILSGNFTDKNGNRLVS